MNFFYFFVNNTYNTNKYNNNIKYKNENITSY